MGCGTSSHPVAASHDEGLGNDVDDPNKHSKSVGGTNKNQQGILRAVQNVEEGEGQYKQVASQPQKQLDVISKTPEQTKQVKSEEELANKLLDNKTTTEESNENDKDSNTVEVAQVSGQGVSRKLSSKDLGDKNLMNAENTVSDVTAQNESRGSISEKNGRSGSRDLVKKTTHDETDLPVTQVIAIPCDRDFGESEKTSTMKRPEEVQELTMKDSTQNNTDLNVMQPTVTSSNQDIADNETPSTSEKSEEKQEEINSATIQNVVPCSATEITAERSSTELQVPENQLDAVDKASEHPGFSGNSEQSVNKEIDQRKFSQENSSADIEVLTAELDDFEQTDNFNQENDKLKQKSTEDTLTELHSEIFSDKNDKRLNSETALPQCGHTNSEPLMAESNLHITVQEENSESVLSCAGPQQEENLSDNHSTATSPCGEESKPQLKDSAICKVKNSETNAKGTMPSRDKDAKNRLITALRLSCKLSPGHLVRDLDVKDVMSVHLLRSLSPGVMTVAELVHKLVYLTELDLSGNLLGPQGFRVICLALRRNVTLKCLNLANNLADTDSSECIGMMVSANSTLERLDVSGNNLGSDYFSRCIGPALRVNQSLKALKFSSCGSSDMSALCEALVEGNSTIEELDASSNHVGAVLGQGLSNILKQPVCSLQYLDIHGTNLGKEGMAILLVGIQNNSSLISLNAAGHQVSCLSFLMEFLYSCICHPTLEELILESTKVLELDEWKPSGLSLTEGSSSLTKLLLSGCSLTNQTLRTLSEKTQGKLACLVHLDLSNNEQLTTECLSSICAMTSSPGQSCSLSVLDFSLNAGGDIAGVIEKLPGLKNLKTLLLKKCRITSAGVVELSKLITLATPDFLRISSVTLDGIKLSGTDALKGMLGLSDMFIPTNPCSLELLSLIGCGLNDRDVKSLMNGIGNGLVIKELRLSANRLTDTAVNYLVDSSGTALSLQTLDLSINKIRNGGAEKLAGALSDKLVYLQSLLLADNCIGKTGIQALVGKVGPTSQLAVLNLKSQQQALGEEDMDEIMEQLAKSLGFDPENSDGCAPDTSLPANFTINLTGLGGEPGELGPKLDSQAVLTDYSAKHRRTLTLEDALQLSAVLSQSENTRASMSQSDWDRVISADKDAPAWLQLSSKRQCAVYVSNLPLSVTAEKLEGQLDSEAECNVMEVYLLKDQILRKPNGLAWVLFTDSASVQRAVQYYNSGQAFMYGTPFVISIVNVHVMADTGSEENAEVKARQEMIQRAEGRKADLTAHAQLVQSNYNESLARHEYAAQHPAYADGRVW